MKKFEDKIVVFHLTDGQRLKAKLSWVMLNNEYDDVLVDVLETDRPENYKNPEAVYAIPCEMIQSVEVCESTK